MVNKSYGRTTETVIQYINNPDKRLFNPNGQCQILLDETLMNYNTLKYRFRGKYFVFGEGPDFYKFVKNLYKELKSNGE